MTPSAISHLILLIAIVHQSQCEENNQQNSKSVYWELQDSLNCYSTVTLGLFENLKKVIEVSSVELGEAEFKSKFDPKSYIFPFYNNYDDYGNWSLFRRTMNEVETAALKGILIIRRWLGHNCTQERAKQIKEFIKIFDEGRDRCAGAPYYLVETTWKLGHTCPEKKDKLIEQSQREGSNMWKKQITSINRFRYR